MRANWILSSFFVYLLLLRTCSTTIQKLAGLKKLFLSTTKTQPPTSSYSPKQQSCCFVVLHRISRKQQNSFVVRPRTNLSAILRSTLKTSGQNLNNTQWLTHDDAHKGGQKKTWENMADDASQRKFQSVTVKTFTPLPPRSFVFSSCWMLLLSAVGTVHAPLSFHLRLERGSSSGNPIIVVRTTVTTKKRSPHLWISGEGWN